MNPTDHSNREYVTAETLWLHYFNRYLYLSGTITDKEYKRMTEKISVRAAQKSHKKGAR